MSSHNEVSQTNNGQVEFNPSTHIRVIVVEAGVRGGPISARFQICNIHGQHSVEWEAISYTWDGQRPTHEIEIDGEIVRVTRNVFRILEDLRLREGRRFLWVDAVCISQDDPDEKSQQVALMRWIYQEALAVIIWLDVDGMEDAAAAVSSAANWMDAMPRPVSPPTSKPLMSLFISENPDVEWHSPFHRMMTVKWFRRAWVVQEATLAKTLLVHLGQDILLWDDFASTTLRFLSMLTMQDIDGTPLEECYRVCQTKNFGEETRQGLSMVNLIVSLRGWLRHFDTPLNPSELVYLCSACQATVPSDKIYAVAGLFGMKTALESRWEFPVNYRLSSDEVFKEFTFWSIQHDNNLDILAQQWHQPDRTSITGWVTDWSSEPGDELTPTGPLMARLRHGQSINSEIVPICRRMNPNTLLVRGFIIDEIGGNSDDSTSQLYAYDPEVNEVLLSQWLSIIPNNERTNSLLFGQRTPTRRTLEQLFATSWRKYPYFSHLWRDGPKSSLAVREQNPQGRWAYVTKRGCLALTVGYLDSHVPFKICYLNGGRGLFVLRPASLVGPTGTPSYTIVSGDCFIDGFEDGRGYEMARELDLEEEDICIE